MNVIASIHQKILNNDFDIEYVSYLFEDNIINILIIHAESWDQCCLENRNWNELKNQYPILRTIPFLKGQHKFIFDEEENTWNEINNNI